ncbi:MAG: DegV family protein [Cellulosilyticum sp.]|nr:DegV family protein [Cellulosilyticum sp.]
MRKIAIITDTASDLSVADIEKYRLKMLHYQIVYKEHTYKDQLEIHSKEVLDKLEIEIPSTSLPSLDEMHQVFNEIQAEGYKEVLVVTLSSGLSGCFNAVNMVKDEFPNLKTVVFDSKTISAPQGYLAIQAARLADKGCSMDEMIKQLEVIREKQHTFFIVDTLKYLVHGGRIGHVSGTVGKLLNLKPIITIADDGKYDTIAKVRGRAKAIRYIAEEANKVMSSGRQYEIYFSHANGQEIKDEIIKEIRVLHPNIEVEGDTWISPVACVHCGPGYVGMLIQEV